MQVFTSIACVVAFDGVAIADTSSVEPTVVAGNHNIATRKRYTGEGRIAICPGSSASEPLFLSDDETKDLKDKLAAWEKKSGL